MEVSPPRPAEPAVVAGGGQVAEAESPLPQAVGCFPRLFRRKGTKSKGKRKGGSGSSMGRWGRRRSPPSPPSHPPADAAGPSTSTISTASALALTKGNVVSTTSTASTSSTLSNGSEHSSSPEAGAGVNMVAFKSPVIINSPQPSLRAVAAAGGGLLRGSASHPQLKGQDSQLGSRQGSMESEPSQAPAIGMNRSMSAGSSLWGMGVSMSRGLSIDDMSIFGRSASGVGGSKLTKRSMSRRMSLEELIVPDDFQHVDMPEGPPLHPRLVPMISNGLARIALHAKGQDMTPETWDVCLSILKPEEMARVKRYKFEKDRRLALGSLLLQRAVIHWTFGIPYDDIVIKRTEKGKPFFTLPEDVRKGFENWNFNVSHHGEYVAIASEPTLLVGLDIMNARERPRSRANSDEFFKAFRRQLSHQEWGSIYEATDEDARLERFYRQWALKEAFIKAIGSGLTMSPRRIEIVNLDNTPRPNSDKPYDRADLRIDGRSRPNWRFKFHQLDHAHVACLSRGPPSDAIPEYRQTLKKQDLTSSPLRYGLESIQPEFESVSLRDLIPASKLAEFDATMPGPDSPVFKPEEVVSGDAIP